MKNFTILFPCFVRIFSQLLKKAFFSYIYLYMTEIYMKRNLNILWISTIMFYAE